MNRFMAQRYKKIGIEGIEGVKGLGKRDFFWHSICFK